MSVITIYRIPQVIELTTGNGATLMNYPVNRTDFTLFRHVDNEVDILVRNIDRKPISFDDAVAVMHIVDGRNQRLLLSRDLTIVDADDGHLRLSLTGEEASDLPLRSLEYSVVMTRGDDGVETLLLTDKHRRHRGVIYVEEGPLPAAKEPVVLQWDDFLARNKAFYAASFAGARMVGNETGIHSAAIELDNFSGKFIVEASYELSPKQTDTEWSVVATEEFIGQTGYFHVPFEGQIMWVRFKVEKQSGDFIRLTYHN